MASIFIYNFEEFSVKVNYKNMGSWSEELNSKIDINLKSSRDKDLRFFRIDEFKRNISRIDEFSVKCPICNKQKINIAETVETIFEAVEVPGRKRREYDGLISRLARHMQKEHGFYAPYYFSYMYAFIGIVAGLISGFFLYKIFPENGEALLTGCISIAIVAAYIAGSRKDNQIRKSKMLM